ncbi:MAG: hypothetical protein JW709_01675 [Sedimentisphaerales bacterium]|nr:hypothetical protein [Sedimentisphaerales bacterium]
MMSNKILKVGILPGMADLYNRLFSPAIIDELKAFIADIPSSIKSQRLAFEVGMLSSTKEQMKAEATRLAQKDIDLIVVALAPYCPSGAVVPAVLESKIPVLLWPVQTVYDFVPEQIAAGQIRLSHGVHAVQDIANVLHRRKKNFGVIHGHFREDGFCRIFEEWAEAARIYTAFANSNPVQIGGHFEDMLDLQISDAPFLAASGIKMTSFHLSEVEAELKKVDDTEITALVGQYKNEFAIAPDVTDAVLATTARGELAVRTLMKRVDAKACGVNFQTLCNTPAIGDAMHVAASRLMAEGMGYAGEGDWVTAAFIHAMHSALGIASFTEIFSVDYKNNRVLLKHWGEGNPQMARNKAEIIKSALNDRNKAEFCIVSMQYRPGPATLVNLNVDSQGGGQLISLYGEITDDLILKSTGPRAMFKPEGADIHSILDTYAYSGGSHHLVLVDGCAKGVLSKLATLTGWSYTSV